MTELTRVSSNPIHHRNHTYYYIIDRTLRIPIMCTVRHLPNKEIHCNCNPNRITVHLFINI